MLETQGGNAPVRLGDRVRVFYNVRLGPGGRIIQSSAKHGPVEFEAGGMEILRKVSQSVVGACVGDVVKVELTALEACGMVDPGLIQAVSTGTDLVFEYKLKAILARGP